MSEMEDPELSVSEYDTYKIKLSHHPYINYYSGFCEG